MAHEREQRGIEWLARDLDFVEGLDHLGIQVVSTNIYSRLVPGISNLTDRARYFSFYAWVLDSFARHAPDKSPDAWRTWLRRHEFVLSAASVACAREEDADDGATAGGVIGARAARRLTRGKSIDITAAALIENGRAAKGTYFKNREGGYAQYYKGPMTVLGLLREAEGRHAPDRQLTAYAGARLASAVEEIDAMRDLREVAVAGGDVNVDDLLVFGLRANPGAIEPTGQEANVLRSLLLGTDAELCAGQQSAERDQRRHSLALALHYLATGDAETWDSAVRGFRWCALEGRLGDALRAWQVPDSLAATALAWAAYQQNELLNYAIENLFSVVLRAIENQALAPRAVARRVAEWACSPTRATASTLSTKLRDAVVTCTAPSPEAAWEGDGTFNLVDLLNHAEGPEEIAACAARLLLRVAADRGRYAGRHPFATIPLGEEIARAREIHLGSWWRRVDDARDHETIDFFEQLVLEWVIYRHLRVATRKLASQGDYTYRLRPEEGSLVRCGAFQPTFTNPRVRQSMRILADVGLAARELNGVTDEGARVLESLR